MVKQRPDFITHSDRTKGGICDGASSNNSGRFKDYAIAAGFADGLPLLSFLAVTVRDLFAFFDFHRIAFTYRGQYWKSVQSS